MTEKHYGGTNNFGMQKAMLKEKASKIVAKPEIKEIKTTTEKKQDNNEDYLKAGRIARQAVEYAKSIIKKGMHFLDIAEKVEAKIIEFGGKPAFPVNLCMNDVAAHYTPSHDDETIAYGLLKVDIGVHVNGCIADTAFSVDLAENKEESEKNKKLIQASEDALKGALYVAKKEKTNTSFSEIGKAIQDAIEKHGFSPIKNLCGHELGRYIVHSGCTIPNYDNKNANTIGESAYAIEPFATSGQGIVYDGKPSGIYRLEARKAVRDALAREILLFVEREYKTLPFCSRWIVKKFGTRALLSLHFLEQAGILHHFSQLVEKSHMPVSQAEHTIIIHGNNIDVTTE